jgi:hypothetical protein
LDVYPIPTAQPKKWKGRLVDTAKGVFIDYYEGYDLYKILKGRNESFYVKQRKVLNYEESEETKIVGGCANIGMIKVSKLIMEAFTQYHRICVLNGYDYDVINLIIGFNKRENILPISVDLIESAFLRDGLMSPEYIGEDIRFDYNLKKPDGGDIIAYKVKKVFL